MSGCELVRSFVNDVYRVDTVTGPFALKIYRHGGWSPDEVAWEQGLISHAAEAGAPVVAPVALSDGRLAGEAPYPEGVRPFALSPWVPGRKPRPPFTDEVYRAFGEVIGQFHAAGDTFRSAHSRRPFELGRDSTIHLPGSWSICPSNPRTDESSATWPHTPVVVSLISGSKAPTGASATATSRWTTST